MTIVSNDRRVPPANGDGSTTQFTYDFKITAETDLDVYLRNTTTEVVTQSIYPGAYTVQNVGNEAGGTITFVTAPTATEQVLILGRSPIDQPTDVTVGEVFFQATLQEALDRIVRLEQQLQEEVDRCIRMEKFGSLRNIEIKEPVTADDTYALVWDDTNQRYQHAAALPTSTVTVTSFAETLLDDATALAARTTLGAQQIVMLTETVELVNDDGETGNTAFGVGGGAGAAAGTAIAALTGTDTATIAIIRVQLFDWNSGFATRSMVVQVRATGTTPALPQEVIANTNTGTTQSTFNVERTLWVNLDGSESFDWNVTRTSISGNCTMSIWLEGYVI